MSGTTALVLPKRRRTLYVVVHCAFTRTGTTTTIHDIRRWHTDPKPRGRGWAREGYHTYIQFDGSLHEGREWDAIGAGVKGWNSESVHVCLEGGMGDDGKTPENNFTDEQFATLKVFLEECRREYPKVRIRGHRDFPNVAKACPCFDVMDWCESVGIDPFR